MNDRLPQLFLLFVSLFCRFATSANIRTSSSSLVTSDDHIQKFTVQMIGYSPQKTDDYVAVSVEATPGYIVGFEPMAHADRVHHMLVYGCTVPASEQVFWRGMETCGWGGGSYILYAWARNAPNLVLPKDVAFSVGHESDGIKYFVLQVHYAQPFAGEVHDFSGVTLHISQRKPAHLAAVMLFVSGTPIPPQLPAFQNNITCMYESQTPIHPFAFRTHTHAMGRLVSAFFKHDGRWNKIGKRNPQWPQLFEAIPNKLTIANGDQMSASCRFDSMDKNRTVRMGAMGVDEMCNFYMMYHYDANMQNPYPQGAICAQDSPQLMRDYPKDGFDLLPTRPELEHHAHQSKTPFGIVTEAIHENLGDVKLGQVAGLAFDNNNHLLVFHRAHRVWDQNTFDNYNILLDKSPIKEPVILVISYHGNQTKVEQKLGGGKFYLPHGIYVDKDGFIYTTDVGSHTVAKWRLDGGELKNVWTSGEALLPGSDEHHYCKPTGITRVGDQLYVTDGYCNSRVVVLDLNGKRVQQFGLPGDELGQFNIPHDIVADSAGRLLVTDRENGRVQHMTTQGHVIEDFKSTMFTNIYSAAVHEDYVFMVPGRPIMGHEQDGIAVFVGRSGTGLIEYAFGPTTRGKREQMAPQFGQPHCLRVSPNGEAVFVGDIQEGKARLWQFRIQREESAGQAAQSTISWPSLPHADGNYSSFFVLLAIAILVLGAYCVKRRCKNLENGVGVFDKKGFKPLRTEETVGFISDGSDSEEE
uniref:Peptidylglycine monooxygenase n=1 Tax=Caenorhabditis japonica TaxID=281687 RepID=A0A8R1HNP1_CAEJA